MRRLTPLKWLAKSALSLPQSVQKRLWGEDIEIDGNRLDSQLRTLRGLSMLVKLPKLEQLPVATGRAGFVAQMGIVNLPQLREVISDDLTIEGVAGRIRLRRYRVVGQAKNSPCLVYFHGGGFVVGDLQSHDRPCQWLAREAGATVIAVDYRLAPECRFPAAYEDALLAYKWVYENRERLQLGAIGVVGDSAGGNLAAVLAQQTVKMGIAPTLQFLIYPVTQFGCTLPSRSTFSEGYFLEKSTMDWFTEQYLPDPEQWKDPTASPIYAESLAGLPRALIVTAGFDPLRDEGLLYGEKLKQAGVEVHDYCAPGMVHGFWSMGGLIDEAKNVMVRFSRQAGELLRK